MRYDSCQQENQSWIVQPVKIQFIPPVFNMAGVQGDQPLILSKLAWKTYVQPRIIFFFIQNLSKSCELQLVLTILNLYFVKFLYKLVCYLVRDYKGDYSFKIYFYPFNKEIRGEFSLLFGYKIVLPGNTFMPKLYLGDRTSSLFLKVGRLIAFNNI